MIDSPNTPSQDMPRKFGNPERQRWGMKMNRTSIPIAIACLATALFSGCDHSKIIDFSPSAVVAAAQSLAPLSTPPRCTTTEVVTNQTWSVVITEAVPGEKFEYYEITFLITRSNVDQSEVTIDAFRINSLWPKPKHGATRVAQRYAEQQEQHLKHK